MTTLFAVTVILAIVAGLRGTWSPCGLSMLSTITPIGERGRGNRYTSTARWYVLGAILGGVSTGTLAAAGALVSGHAGLSGRGAAFVAMALAIVTMASDRQVFGFHLPIHRRQVNERWLDHYRPWFYGVGFGWQIGSGLFTYITTSANYLLVAFMVLGGSWRMALFVGAIYGLTRGLSVALTRHVRSAADLHELHARIQSTAVRVREVMIATQGIVAVLLGLSRSPTWAAAAACVVGAVWILGRRARALPACSLDVVRTERAIADQLGRTG